MKNKYYICRLFFCLLTLTACKKEAEAPADDEPEVVIPVALPQKFMAKIDNVDWEANDFIMAIIENKKGENELIIFASNKKRELLTLQAINVTGTGTYTYATNRNKNNAQFSKNDRQHYYSLFTDDFTLTITKFDKTTKRISGTFSFSAEAAFDQSVIRVTSGVFNDLALQL